MQKIVPHLWFDREAVEAAEFYSGVFPDSEITAKSVIKDTPSGDCDQVSFKVWGMDFMAISAGPHFHINPAVSFIVGCEAEEEVDGLWEKFSEGGTELMPLILKKTFRPVRKKEI